MTYKVELTDEQLDLIAGVAGYNEVNPRESRELLKIIEAARPRLKDGIVERTTPSGRKTLYFCRENRVSMWLSPHGNLEIPSTIDSFTDGGSWRWVTSG